MNARPLEAEVHTEMQSAKDCGKAAVRDRAKKNTYAGDVRYDS